MGFLCLATPITAPWMADPVGGDLQVNAYTTGEQSKPAVATDAAGNFVVVWRGTGIDGDGFAVQGQRFDSLGQSRGSSFQVNTYTTDDQRYPLVDMQSDGGFVVVWRSQAAAADSSSSSVQGQRFSSDGMPVGSQFQVNTYTTNGQFTQKLSVHDDGSFVVVWASNGSPAGPHQDTSFYSIHGRRFASNGAAVGDQFQVNTYTTGFQSFPDVAMNSSGDFLVVWGSNGSAGDTSSFSVQGRRYGSDGTPTTGQFQINQLETGSQHLPSVASRPDGSWAVAWRSVVSAGSDSDGTSIQTRQVSSDGIPQGVELQVNTYTTGDQSFVAAASENDGRLVVAWRSEGSPGSDYSGLSIQARRFDSVGMPMGDQFQVNTYTTGEQDSPRIAASADGDFKVVWQSDGSEGSPGATPDTDDKSVQVRVFTDRVDLAVMAVESADPVSAEAPLSYHLDIINLGPVAAPGVSLTYSLPLGTTLISADGMGWTCNEASGEVTCDHGVLTAGAWAATVTVSIVAPSEAIALESIFAVFSQNPDPQMGNNNAMATTTVQASTDLALQLSAMPDPATAGEPVTYTFDVTNLGPSTSTGSTITGNLPAGLTFSSSSDCSHAGGAISCTVGRLSPSAQEVLSFQALIAADQVDPLTLSAQLGADQTDPQAANNSDSTETAVRAEADLILDAIVDPDPAVAGENINYHVTVTNRGPSDVTDVVVSGALPQGAESAGTTGCAQDPVGSPDCGLSRLASGASDGFTLEADISAGATEPLVFQISVASETPLVLIHDDSVILTTPVTTRADLSLDLSTSPTTPVAGGLLTVQARVANNGPSDADGVFTTIQLPPGLELTLAGLGCSLSAETVVGCNSGSLKAGESRLFNLELLLAPGVDQLTLAAETTGAQEDPELGDNTVEITVSPGREADLALSKTVEPHSVVPGGVLTYEFSVINQGPSEALELVLTDALPEQVGFLSASPGCAYANGTVVCALDRLEPQAHASFTVTVTTEASVNGAITNLASVSASGSDPVVENNQATATVVLEPTADLRLQVTAPETVDPGEFLTYTLMVTNQGPANATEVAVEGELPSAVVLESTSGCMDKENAIPSCYLGSVPVGASRSLELTTRVSPEAAGALRLYAEVLSETEDPQPADNAVTGTTVVPGGRADLSVEITGPSAAIPGEAIGYRVTVGNAGPQGAQGARLIVPLPSELLQAQWTCSATDEASCGPAPATGPLDQYIDLPVGSVMTFDVAASVLAEAVGTLELRAFVLGESITDLDPSNDDSMTTTELEPVAAVGLTLGNQRDQVIAGKTIAYDLEVVNTGPSAASEIVLSAQLPFDSISLLCFDGDDVPCGESVGGSVVREVFSLGAGEQRIYRAIGVLRVPNGQEQIGAEATLDLSEGISDPEPSDNLAFDLDLVISGQVSELEPLPSLPEGEGPDIVFNAQGQALVVFEQVDGDGATAIRGFEVDLTGAGGEDLELSSELGSRPRVEFDPLGAVGGGLLGDLRPPTKASGLFLTLWQTQADPSSIRGRLVRPGGSPVGAPFRLSTRGTSQIRPDVTRRPSGGFLTVWQSQGGNAEQEGVFFRFLDPAGRPLGGSETRISRGNTRKPQNPAVASQGEDPRFLVVWDRPKGGNLRRVSGRRMSDSGELIGNYLDLSSGSGSQTTPALAFDPPSRRYLVVWRQQGTSGDGGIAGRVFDVQGRPLGDGFTVGTTAARNPRVANESGSFTVVWEERLSDVLSLTFGQLVNRSGRTVGPRFRISTGSAQVTDDSSDPSKVEIAPGRPAVAFVPREALAGDEASDVFAVVWADRERGPELHSRRFGLTADLQLSTFDEPDPVLPGQTELRYTVAVQNLSSTDAEQVTVDHQIPTGVELVASEGCAEDPLATITCTLGTVPGGGGAMYSLLTRPSPGLSGSQSLWASVASVTPDPDLADNIVEESTRFGVADLMLSSAGVPSVVQTGERSTWTLTVTNEGPSPAPDVEAHLQLPAGLSPSAVSGCAGELEALPICSLGVLSIGEQRSFHLEVEYGAELSGSVAGLARVESNLFDPDDSDNTVTFETRISGSQLGIRLHAPSKVPPGAPFTYSIVVSNPEPAAVDGAVILSSLPGDLSFRGSRGCDQDPEGLPICNLGTLSAGSQKEVTIEVEPLDHGSESYHLQAEVRSFADTGSNVAFAEVEVGSGEPLELLGERFVARVSFRNQHAGGELGFGSPIRLSENAGYFYFFDPAVVDLMVKVLDGGAINDKFWVFYGASTDLEYDLTIEDRFTGASRTYHNPAGEICGRGDTDAFPADAASSMTMDWKSARALVTGCPGESDRLCLLNGRFRVSVTLIDPQVPGTPIPARPVADSDSSGFFYFFDPDNLELMVKLLDGREINGKLWFFYGGLSSLEYRIEVEDLETGERRAYRNPPGDLCGRADLEAF